VESGRLIVAACLLTVLSPLPAGGARGESPITIRTGRYPRPPYSGATYYIYERGGRALCTKLEVCNKFGDCASTYHRGRYRDAEDVETGAPYRTTPVVPIPGAKLRKHACLVRFRLGGT
jgi:hypothetical protein